MMLGLLNNGVEHFLVGVLLLLLLLLLGVVGCIDGIGDCKETEETSRGGGGGIDDADSECAFGGNERSNGGGGNTKGGGSGGGGGGGGGGSERAEDEVHEEGKGTGCEDFIRTSSSVSRISSRNFFSSCSNAMLSSVIFLLASRKTFTSSVRALRVTSVFVRT